MMSDEVVARMRAAGASGTYTVSSGSKGGGGPTVSISATDIDPEAAKRTVVLVWREFVRQLQTRQQAAGAPAGTLIRPQLAIPPLTTKRLVGSTIRAVSATIALGTALTFSVAYLAQSLAERRKQRMLGSRRRRNRVRASTRPRGQPGAPSEAHAPAAGTPQEAAGPPEPNWQPSSQPVPVRDDPALIYLPSHREREPSGPAGHQAEADAAWAEPQEPSGHEPADTASTGAYREPGFAGTHRYPEGPGTGEYRR